MTIIQIQQNEKVLLDDEDIERVIAKGNWYPCGGKQRTTIANVLNPNLRLANFIMKDLVNSYDHKNRIYNDFQKNNLRVATKSQNEANKAKQDRFKECHSQYKGVYWQAKNKKWYSVLIKDKKRFYLGTFVKEENAALAYNEAALKYHGEFAYINEITIKK